MGLVGLAHATSHFAHLLLAPLFPVFMKEFGLSFSEVGSLMALFFLVSGVGQACAGFVVDRIGARPILFAAMVLFALASLAASQANGYGMLMVAAMLAGLGNAPFHPVDFTILNQRVSAARLGHAFSVHGLTGNLGWALSPVFLVGISSMADWRVAYQAAAVLYLLVLGLLYWQRDKLHTEVVRRHAASPAGNDLAFLKLPVVWWCFAFFLFSSVTLAVVQSYGVSILKAVHGVTLEAATLTLTSYMLCSALGMLVGGFVVAYTKQSDRVVAWAMGVGAFTLLLAASGSMGPVGTMVILASTGFAVGVGGPSRDMMIKRATPKGATGRVYGTVYSGLDTGFAVAPLMFGLFMDKGWYAATLAGAGLFLLIGVYTALGVGKRTAAAIG